MSKNSGPRSDLVFNSLSVIMGTLALSVMTLFLLVMGIIVGVSGLSAGLFIAFFAVFWAEAVMIGLGIYFTVKQLVRGLRPKLVLGLVLNICAVVMVLTFVIVMCILGHGAQLVLMGL